MTDKNAVAFNQNEMRRAVLKEMRVVDGKPMSYGRFLRNYLREMSFTYHLIDGNVPKSRRIMATFEDVIKQEWFKYPRGVSDGSL